jgi:hypothetical protein
MINCYNGMNAQASHNHSGMGFDVRGLEYTLRRMCFLPLLLGGLLIQCRHLFWCSEVRSTRLNYIFPCPGIQVLHT